MRANCQKNYGNQPCPHFKDMRSKLERLDRELSDHFKNEISSAPNKVVTQHAMVVQDKKTNLDTVMVNLSKINVGIDHVSEENLRPKVLYKFV